MALESTIYIFLTTAAIFYLVAAIGKNRLFLWPAGGTLILLGSMLIVTAGVQVNAGDSTTFIGNTTGTSNSSGFQDNPNTTTTSITNKTITFRNIEDNYDKFSPSNLLGLILIIAGVMSMLMGSSVKGSLLDKLS